MLVPALNTSAARHDLPGYVVDAAVYGLVRQAFKDKSAGDGGCERALEEACGAQRGGVFACAECAGANLQALSAAGCGNDAISAWCAGVPLTKSTWRPAPEVGPHVYALSLAPGAGITQLFAGHASAHDDTLQMLVPARWPNARWDDKTMFEGPEHWAHAGPAGDGAEHNVSTMVGLLYDYVPTPPNISLDPVTFPIHRHILRGRARAAPTRPAAATATTTRSPRAASTPPAP